MLKKRIAFFIRKRTSKIQSRLRKFNLSWTRVLESIVVAGVVLLLGYNIYTAYNKGVTNATVIAQEQEKVQELEAESAKLSDLEKYYSSVEFRRNYARDAWNLAEPGAELFEIKRQDQVQIEQVQSKDPIVLTDNIYWWKKLILGT